MSFPFAFVTSIVMDMFIICKSCGQMYSLQIQRTNVFFQSRANKCILLKLSEPFQKRPHTLQVKTETGAQIYCQHLAVLSHTDSHKIDCLRDTSVSNYYFYFTIKGDFSWWIAQSPPLIKTKTKRWTFLFCMIHSKVLLESYRGLPTVDQS